MKERPTVMGISPTTPTNVVFLHGFMGRGVDWDDVVAVLGDGFHCICPDLPGHGVHAADLPQREDWFPATIDHVIAAMDAAGMAQAALVGYSMGGRVALATALGHPRRFTHLVLESASPGISDAEQRQERLQHDGQVAGKLERAAAFHGGFEGFLRDWYAMPLFGSLQRRPDLLEDLVRRRLENDPVALAKSLRGLSVGRQADLWPALETLAMPALVLVGAVDRKYRILAEKMSERCPRLALHEMTACGHNVHAENPDGYTTVLRAFLESP